MLRKIKIIIISFVTLVIVCALIFAVGQFRNGGHKVSSQLSHMEGTINEIGELATAELEYSIVENVEKEGPLELGLTKYEAVVGCPGVIKAGIDFAQIQITDMDAEECTITIKLPKARLLSNELDEEHLEVYLEKGGLFNKLTFEDMGKSLADMKAEGEKKAKKSDLLDSAQANAQTIIESMIKSEIGEDWTIIWK